MQCCIENLSTTRGKRRWAAEFIRDSLQPQSRIARLAPLVHEIEECLDRGQIARVRAARFQGQQASIARVKLLFKCQVETAVLFAQQIARKMLDEDVLAASGTGGGDSCVPPCVEKTVGA